MRETTSNQAMSGFDNQRPAVVLAVEAFFVRHRGRLVYVHAAMFCAFFALIAGPLFLPEPAQDAGALEHFTPFANAVVWGFWFPLVLLSTVFTGRSWCGLLCPMGAAGEWANKLGPQWRVPAWLRWEGTPIASFIFITVLGQTVGVRDHPEAMAEIFGGTMAAAIVIGFLYSKRKRAWCRHMCPIGLLLGIFSRLGAVQFRPKLRKSGGDRYEKNGPCPLFVDTRRKEESRHCIECFRCVRPGARAGVELNFRRPGREVEEIRRHHPNRSEVWFLFLGSGVALGGFNWLMLDFYQDLRRSAGAWFIERGQYWIGESGPAWLMSVHPERREVFNWLDFFTISGFMLGFMLAIALALALATLLAALLSRRAGAEGELPTLWTELGYQFAPIAMISLVLGVGEALFGEAHGAGQGGSAMVLRLGLFAASLVWSIWLANRILAGQGVAARGRWLPMIPGLFGSAVVTAAWWPAIVGI